MFLSSQFSAFATLITTASMTRQNDSIAVDPETTGSDFNGPSTEHY